METASSYATGLYTPSEQALTIRKLHNTVTAANRKAVIVLHGRNASSQLWIPGTGIGNHAQILANAGYVVLAIDNGGPSTFNNNAATHPTTGATAGAVGYALTQALGSSKVFILAWSMGGGDALVYQKYSPSKVAGMLLFAPNTNLDRYHSDATYTAEIDTAYGGNYAANAVGHKIADEYTTWRNQCPIRIVHGDADTTAPIADSQAFVAGVGQSQVDLVTVAGGTHYTFDTVAPATTLAYVNAASW